MAAYLQRIDYSGSTAPSAEVLESLHSAHATHIPFENLDIILGRPIRLDLESLQAKLVHARRGGYCFEQNSLFAAVLGQLGFTLTCLAARVRFGSTRISPRTHMLLKVEVDGETWLADVGFGGHGLLYPVRLADHEIFVQHGWTYQLARQADVWILQLLRPEGWLDLYAFTEEPQYPADYEVANHYTSTYPESHFVRTLTAQLPIPPHRYVLRGRELSIEEPEGVTARTIDNERELVRLFSEVFGLELPPGTGLPVVNS
jgi:N-hydroxyarylamine O-acetyltransferase